MNKTLQNRRVILCAATKGVTNVNVEKNAPAVLSSIVNSEASSQEKIHLSYTSDSYQKILDYHVGEILLTTIIFGVIILIRLHH
jgi:DNA repair photolyase